MTTEVKANFTCTEDYLIEDQCTMEGCGEMPPEMCCKDCPKLIECEGVCRNLRKDSIFAFSTLRGADNVGIKRQAKFDDMYCVVKWDDLSKYLPEEDLSEFMALLHKVGTGRVNAGKIFSNQYIVVNADEEWAGEVAEVVAKKANLWK